MLQPVFALAVQSGFKEFQWAPTLVGECYATLAHAVWFGDCGFNGHPPLWVNATAALSAFLAMREIVSMGTHPWG